MWLRNKRSVVLGSFALFIGIVAIGSTIPDIFMFVPTEKDMGHTPLIPVLTLCCVAVAFGIGQTSRHFLK